MKRLSGNKFAALTVEEDEVIVEEDLGGELVHGEAVHNATVPVAWPVAPPVAAAVLPLAAADGCSVHAAFGKLMALSCRELEYRQQLDDKMAKADAARARLVALRRESVAAAVAQALILREMDAAAQMEAVPYPIEPVGAAVLGAVADPVMRGGLLLGLRRMGA